MMETLDRLIPEEFSYLGGRIRLLPADGDEVHECRALLDPERLSQLIDRYAARLPGADRRAAFSVWTMYYFSHLVIAPLIFWLRERRVLPLAIDGTKLCTDPETGAPLAFVIPNTGEARPDSTVFDAMSEAIRHHAAPMIEASAGANRLSPRLLWNNLAVYADWAIRTFAGHEPTLRDAALLTLSEPTWPCGWQNPMAGQLRQETDESGACFTRRKICCLRYVLPGVPGCGMVCPLPAGRI